MPVPCWSLLMKNQLKGLKLGKYIIGKVEVIGEINPMHKEYDYSDTEKINSGIANTVDRTNRNLLAKFRQPKE